MCGLAGYIDFSGGKPIDGAALGAMTRRLAHRGPDDSGCVLVEKDRFEFFRDDAMPLGLESASVGLGHRRLSILDLSERGRQPMSADGGRVWMVYNGEVYNYLELKIELERAGRTFSSDTDSEVVLAAYLQWGVECFGRFNGMWAIALYDEREQRLVLSRDRFGKKPLYFHIQGQRIFFASEIKALLKHPDVPREVNETKLADYAGRHYRYVDDDYASFFKGIGQVPKSSFAVFNRSGWSDTKYWSLQPDEASVRETSDAEVVEEFQALLEDAVRLRLRSDVPVGCMLSGGMDSTSVTRLALEHNPDLQAFSGVTGEGYFDESEHIDAVVDHTGVRHAYVRPGPAGLLKTLDEMLGYHDEPVCTVTWYAKYIIMREIAKHRIPVMLTGHGGDELLAGYWDHYHYFFADMREQGLDDEPEVQAWLRNHGRSMQEYRDTRAYIEDIRRNPAVELDKFSAHLDRLSPGLLSRAKKLPHASSFPPNLPRRLHIELMQETIPPSLRAEDRNMMAFSIENRVPFLDYRLAEFCFRLDGRRKIRNGLGKWTLRESMKGLLPESVRTRKDKAGFNAPFGEWIRTENRAEVEALIEKSGFVNSEVYDQDSVRRTFREHLAGADHYMFFWQYVNVHLWHDRFFGPSASA